MKKSWGSPLIIILTILIVICAAGALYVYKPANSAITNIIQPKDPVDITGTWETTNENEVVDFVLKVEGEDVTIHAQINYGLEDEDDYNELFGDDANSEGFDVASGKVDIEKEEITFTEISSYMADAYGVSDSTVKSWGAETVKYELSEDDSVITIELGGEELSFSKTSDDVTKESFSLSSSSSSSSKSSASSSSEDVATETSKED
jgi:hypothetical protein